MSVVHRIGFPPFLEVLTTSSFFFLVFLFWAVTPGMMVVIGLVGESRMIPLDSARQFLSFFPGDLFLGLGVAAALMAARDLPEKGGWWTAPVVHMLVLVVAAAAAYWLTFEVELKGGVYPKRALLSPTKIYHNGILYVIYGYIAAMTFIADLAGLGLSEVIRGGWLTWAVVCIGIWLAFVVLEPIIFGPEGMAKKAGFAHVADWRPRWSRS